MAFLIGDLGFVEFIILFCFFGFNLLALIDILKSEFSGNNKLIWVIVSIFIPFIGAILYLFIGRNQKIQKSK